ncbi:hypothetical protein C1I97_37960, partial [Streptomyces sp. NTH33]|uniref:hypothetical protein n=1 Tax=Streptomyces sp. NTH33 TaxID=1735453 RepID=UPI000DB10A40
PDTAHAPEPVYCRLDHPVIGPALVLDLRALRRQPWWQRDGRPTPQATEDTTYVPVWAVHLSAGPDEAVFFATAQWRAREVVLAAVHRACPPATAEVVAWAESTVHGQALVNFPLPRPGYRAAHLPETEYKLTLDAPVNPVVLAGILREHLTGTGIPLFEATVHRRILRSQIYLPRGDGLREYAALTPRADGTWWVKTKRLTEGRLHKQIRSAPAHPRALALAQQALGDRPLIRIGHLHRATWDLLSPADTDGHWSTITVDTTTLAPRLGTLQQIEVEYGACFTATPTTMPAERIEQA